MEERFCTVGDIELCYQEFGSPADPTVLLIMGLGLSMDFWRTDFCVELASRGLHVVRFDNRDAGKSTSVGGRGIGAWEFLRRRAHPAYTLGDMADDAAGLLTGPAHVVGASMGALIAQELAIRHPERVLSLTSIMGRPGDRRSGRTARRLLPMFLRPAPRTYAGQIEDMVKAFRRIGSSGRTPADDEDVRATMSAMLNRETGDGSGSGRQLAAVIAERDRTADLRALRVPALVVHGDRDRVILPSGGRATADAIPGSVFRLVPGMGHDLARRLWPDLITDLTALTSSSR